MTINEATDSFVTKVFLGISCLSKIIRRNLTVHMVKPKFPLLRLLVIRSDSILKKEIGCMIYISMSDYFCIIRLKGVSRFIQDASINIGVNASDVSRCCVNTVQGKRKQEA